MKTLEKGEAKIKKICDVLRQETLEPAKQEAEGLVEQAKQQAAEIVKQAEQEVEQLHAAAKQKIEAERNVFHSTLKQAGKQALESLRQDIEERLFDQELTKVVESGSADPDMIGRLIDHLIQAIDKQGMKADLAAVIPQAVDASKVASAMGESAVKKLQQAPMNIGSFKGGAQLKWLNKKLTIDMTDDSLKELLSGFVRKDFRKLLFGE